MSATDASLPLIEALRRLMPAIERGIGGLVFTADRAGEVAADMNAIRAALAQQAPAVAGRVELTEADVAALSVSPRVAGALAAQQAPAVPRWMQDLARDPEHAERMAQAAAEGRAAAAVFAQQAPAAEPVAWAVYYPGESKPFFWYSRPTAEEIQAWDVHGVHGVRVVALGPIDTDNGIKAAA